MLRKHALNRVNRGVAATMTGNILCIYIHNNIVSRICITCVPLRKEKIHRVSVLNAEFGLVWTVDLNGI